MDNERLKTSISNLRHRLHKHGLEGIVGTFLEATEPLAVFGAQFLYVFQPVLGLFWEHEAIHDWASLLETPGGLAWFRQQLMEDNNDGN